MEHHSNDSVMIDYETLDTKILHELSRAVFWHLILSDILTHSLTLRQVSLWHRTATSHLIDYSDEAQGNRTISQSTSCWWNSLPEHVRRRVFDKTLHRESLKEHLQIVVEFLKFHRPKYVWSPSPRFDLNILEDIWEALREEGVVDFFIDFRKEMDTRTLEAFIFGSSKEPYKSSKRTKIQDMFFEI